MNFGQYKKRPVESNQLQSDIRVIQLPLAEFAIATPHADPHRE